MLCIAFAVYVVFHSHSFSFYQLMCVVLTVFIIVTSSCACLIIFQTVNL